MSEQAINEAYERYDSDPRVHGPDDMDAFRDAVRSLDLVAEVERMSPVVEAVYGAQDFLTTVVWQGIHPRHTRTLYALAEAMKRYEAAGGRNPAQDK